MRKLIILCLASTLAVGRAAWYPYTPSTSLPFGVDTSSGAIPVPAFPYWGQTVSNIWVSQHGILTFDGDNSDTAAPSSLPFPTGPGSAGKLLALFWVDHGALGNDVSYYTSSAASLLTQASNDVATYFPCEPSFTPTDVFVATWLYVWPDDYHYGYYSYYHCYTYTHTYPYHSTWYYTYYVPHTYTTSTYYCYTYTYWVSYCYSYSGSYHCTSYPTYTSYCHTTYYTYTTYWTYTYTSTSWWTSTYTTYYCYSTYTYAPENTYQVALATDGTRTFALLCYDHIEWADDNNGYAVALFNRGDGTSHLELPYSGTASVMDLDISSNVGVPGLFAFRVDSTPTDIPCTDCQCHLLETVTAFNGATVDPVPGSGNQKAILVERSDVGDACRFRLQAIVSLESGHVEVIRVVFRFGLHTNPDKYATRLTLKTDEEKFKVGNVETPLTIPVHDFTDPDGTNIKVQRTGLAYEVTSNTCDWSFDYDPVADTVDYIGSPVVTTGLCGSCV